MTIKVNDTLIEDSNRSTNSFGHLKIDNCVITAESVDGYLGKELKSKDLPPDVLAQLEDNKIYQVYRPAEALKKALDSYNDIPLTDEHHFVDITKTNKHKWLGSVSGVARFEDGKVINRVSIWDKDEVAKHLNLTDGFSEVDFSNKIRNSLTMVKPREGLSGGYGFKLLAESGEWNGKHYDFKMRDIECNHVALVGSPRVAAARLADNSINILEDNEMSTVALIERLRKANPQLVADTEEEMKKEKEAIADKNKKGKDEKICTKDNEFKESTKGGAHSTDEDPIEDNDLEVKDEDLEDKKMADKKSKDLKNKGKDSTPIQGGIIMTEDSIQALVKQQLKEQLSAYNLAKDSCERAIGKASFAMDASPDDMYTGTLKALGIACDNYSLETKQALVKHIGDNKVITSKQPAVVMDSVATDSFSVIKF